MEEKRRIRITWDDLTVNFESFDPGDLMKGWRWLIDESMHLFLVSAIGDMFLQDADGRVYWFDTGTAGLEEVAGSVEEFKKLMVQPENADQWFIPQLVGDLKAAGVELKPGQCYSYKVPPVLGGEIELENFEPADLSVHFGILGQIHEQTKDLPPGTKVKFDLE
jgi:hypothetical protein